MHNIQICTKCICDSTIPSIEFDADGVCNFCKNYELIENEFPGDNTSYNKFKEIVDEIKKERKDEKYDCLIGISGGTDSIYTLYLAKKVMGLRPLALHIDDGWDSKISVENMENAIRILDVDFETVVLNPDEIKDLQISFLKASVPDIECPTDAALTAVIYKTAVKFGIKHIFIGNSFRTEGKMPPSWSYIDGKYIKSVHQKFGQMKLNEYPNLLLLDYFYYFFIKRLKIIKPLYYLVYNKKEVKQLLEKELNWQDYGTSHYESIFTRFGQGYLLPTKFGIDKRKIHYSAQVRSKQMSREEALNKLSELLYDQNMIIEDQKYFVEKLGLTNEEFTELLNKEPKKSSDFKTYYPLFCKLRILVNLAYKMNLAPTRFYGSYER